MAKEKPLWRCCAFRLCLLSAALLFCLQLTLELRRSWSSRDRSEAQARRPSGSSPPGWANAPALPQLLPGVHPPPGVHLPPGHSRPPAASRRQVTYLRSSRRGEAELGCCPPGGSSHRKFRWHIDLQPWASPSQSLDEEAMRFLKYIGTTQISCNHLIPSGLKSDSGSTKKPWPICLDEKFSLAHQIHNKRCRLYSLGLGNEDTHFELRMASDGCEVHRFDPSIKSAHVQESQHLWFHRLSIDWRDPHPAIAVHKLQSTTKKLGTILNEFGHNKIDVLKADLESAEWKILENLILEGVLDQIGQLVFEIHLHWPGFEIGGNDSSVVRFWYSLLKELERKDFRLFYTYKDLSKPQLFLKKELFNASSCYILSWVNMRWK
ncbi:methyltransferase-like protein 24 isoform X2 [Dromiciops gliroides]|uniref:methyltransferase-like protein 24 isoform X2 n=1 Tax=Dromiciops gliroides TaxID=33562 RepID=UPI001CC6246B|nr:methyltransferase-like protein 24 isoform X2 [Dromiciops gliroides]